MNSFDKTSIKRLIILGHTSFIGTHLTSLLKKIHPKIEIIGKNSKCIDLTSLEETKKLRQLIDSNTSIIMLSTNKQQKGAEVSDFMQNIKMTENLCLVMRDCPPKRFIFFSTQAVYGEDINNPDIKEDTPVNPTSYYGLAKYTSEKLLWKTFESSKDNSFLIVRMPRIIGPGDNFNNYGPTMFTYKAFCREPISIWGDGLELRDYVYIQDLADIVEKLVFSNYQGIINIASGKSYSFMDILKVVESVHGRKLVVKHMPRTGSKVNHVFNVKNLKVVIGKYNFTPLKQSIALYSNYLNKHYT